MVRLIVFFQFNFVDLLGSLLMVMYDLIVTNMLRISCHNHMLMLLVSFELKVHLNGMLDLFADFLANLKVIVIVIVMVVVNTVVLSKALPNSLLVGVQAGMLGFSQES